MYHLKVNLKRREPNAMFSRERWEDRTERVTIGFENLESKSVEMH